MSQDCVLRRRPFRRKKDKYLVKGKSKFNFLFELERQSPLAYVTKDEVVWLQSITFEAAFIRESET